MSTTPRIPLPDGVTTASTQVQGETLRHYLPDLLAKRNAFFNEVMETDVLDAVLKEQVRLRNAIVTDCDY